MSYGRTDRKKRARARKKMTSQRVEVSVYELRITNPEGSPIEPNELHDYIMDAFVNDKIKLGKARRMLALCEQPAEIVQHEV